MHLEGNLKPQAPNSSEQNQILQCNWAVPNESTATEIEYSTFCDTSLDRKFRNGKLVQQNTKNILLGADISGFCEVFPNNDNNSPSIKYKSFKSDYNLKNASVSGINMITAIDVHSYLIENTDHDDSKNSEMKYQYMVVFEYMKGYNVYDMINDCWLLDSNVKGDEGHIYDEEGARSLLITDDILLISSMGYLYFYWISVKSGHITNPILIKKYEYASFPSMDHHFDNHGMCCVDYNISYNDININKNNQKSGHEKIQSITFKVYLFGSDETSRQYEFLDSFLQLNIILSFDKSFDTLMMHDINITNNNYKGKINNMLKIDIKENMIERDMLKYSQNDEKYLDLTDMYCFGYQCLYNDKNEAIIIIIGGCCFHWKNSNDIDENKKRQKQLSKSVIFYNTATNELTVKPNVKFLIVLYI